MKDKLYQLLITALLSFSSFIGILLISGLELRKILMYLCATLFSAVVLFNRPFGIILFSVLIPFLRANIHINDFFDLSVVDLFAIYVFLLSLLNRKLVKITNTRWIKIYFVLLAWISLLCIRNLVLHREATLWLFHLKNYFVYGILAWVVLSNVNKEKYYSLMGKMFGIVLIVLGLYSLIQYVGISNIDWLLQQGVKGSMEGRISSFVLFHPNMFALYLLSLTPFVWYSLKNYCKNIFTIPVQIFFLAVIVIAIFFTFSRTAWISGLLALLFLSKQKINKLLFVILFIILLCIVINFSTKYFFEISLSEVMYNRFIQLKSTNYSWRLLIWTNSLELFEKNLLFGIGIGNFENFHRDAFLLSPPVIHAHNTFLMFGVEAGIIGIIIFCVFVFKILYDLNKSMKYSPVIKGFMGFFVIAFVMAFTEWIFFNRVFAIILFLMLGYAEGFISLKKKDISHVKL